MRLTVIATLAACCSSARAFTDTSPFVLFSTSKFSSESTSKSQLQTSQQVSESAREILSSCPSSRYLIVSQPNLNAAHIKSGGGAPKLRRTWDSKNVQGRYSVAEVAGQVNPKELAYFIRASCEGKTPSIDEMDLNAIPSSATAWTMRKNDDYLGLVLDQYEAEGDYTVVYTSQARPEDLAGEAKHYMPVFSGSLNMELKRQVGNIDSRAINSTIKLPLFEKYQFFTPGIFMGLIGILVFVSILGVGIKALGSLEVSYGAFEKDNGPSQQSKKQQ